MCEFSQSSVIDSSLNFCCSSFAYRCHRKRDGPTQIVKHSLRIEVGEKVYEFDLITFSVLLYLVLVYTSFTISLPSIQCNCKLKEHIKQVLKSHYNVQCSLRSYLIRYFGKIFPQKIATACHFYRTR